MNTELNWKYLLGVALSFIGLCRNFSDMSVVLLIAGLGFVIAGYVS